jgi:hypothetical protein
MMDIVYMLLATAAMALAIGLAGWWDSALGRLLG